MSSVSLSQVNERQKQNFYRFRLKKLQVTSLIANDGLMASMNISIPTNDFIKQLEQFPVIWHYERDRDHGPYPYQMYANWTEKYETSFTRILHPKGFCYTFNFPEASQLYDLDK
jgi:hypothetical protein